ncbi:MAG: ubiquinone biosynthesis protein [Polyangiaceae bacterium]|nr:ubiquinone biosynthesis protein [Polyangiaceae bacterium]
MRATGKKGLRVVEAGSAVVALMRDPDDTKQVFRLLDAMTSGTPAAFREKFALSRGGARLLERRPKVLDVLQDRAALAALPAGSVGRAYLAFMQRDDLSADFLVRASAQTPIGARPDDVGNYIEMRLRDTHDLWHVVTGYGGDLLGEAALLAFTFMQTYSPGIGVLAAIGVYKADDPDSRRLILDAFARGARSAWLPAVEWEALLAEDLTTVRQQLRLYDPPCYEPFYAKDLPPGGLFGDRAA